MSVTEISFHNLTEVKVDTGARFIDIDFYNAKGESVLITVFVNDKNRRAFNALASCLNAEFNPGENDEASTSSDNTSTDNIPF